MISHKKIACLLVRHEGPALQPFIEYLQSIARVQLRIMASVPDDLSPYDVVITAASAGLTCQTSGIERFVNGGGGWLCLVDDTDGHLPDIFGAQLNPAGPQCEIRVLLRDRAQPLWQRLPEAFYVQGTYHPLRLTAENVWTMLYADWHYEHQPVCICRPAGRGHAVCTTLQEYEHPVLQQVLYRIILLLGGQQAPELELGVGILGYAPSVGRLHGLGAAVTPGLRLRAVCDLNPQRIAQARKDFADVTMLSSAQALAADPDVNVVIVATPPQTHASLCLQMMKGGKHVVCEKPLALNRAETGALADTADKMKVHLGCHQNRRWDVDYLAIKQALSDGRIGELFFIETFVGGFSHPCGYWHSHAAISGGTAYDWGGHYLDWIVSLVPSRVRSVMCTRHKRVWHDVTNADQECIHLLFDGGQEASFMHSDIAAIRKPKWYLLGTEGAIIAHWQDVAVYEIDPVVYFHRRDIPPTEMPPRLRLHRRHHTGSIVPQELVLPPREDYCFHRNLADHLLTGEPVAAPLEQSITVVGILEAAARSAAQGGTREVCHA